MQQTSFNKATASLRRKPPHCCLKYLGPVSESCNLQYHLLHHLEPLQECIPLRLFMVTVVCPAACLALFVASQGCGVVDQDPKQRLTMPRVMKHAWVTKRGAWPLRTVRETVRAGDAIGADDEPEMPDFMSTLNVLDVPRAVGRPLSHSKRDLLQCGISQALSMLLSLSGIRFGQQSLAPLHTGAMETCVELQLMRVDCLLTRHRAFWSQAFKLQCTLMNCTIFWPEFNADMRSQVLVLPRRLGDVLCCLCSPCSVAACIVLQDHLLDVLRPGLGERSYRDGDFLIRQGEQSTHLFYILEGQVEVLLKLAPSRESASYSRS